MSDEDEAMAKGDKWQADRHEHIARSGLDDPPAVALARIMISIGSQFRSLAISFECMGEMIRQVEAEKRGQEKNKGG